MEIVNERRRGLWREAFAINGSITPHVLPHVAAFGLIATAIVWLATFADRTWGFRIAVQVAPYELAGAALGVLLVLRTNSGYERWVGGKANVGRNRQPDTQLCD